MTLGSPAVPKAIIYLTEQKMTVNELARQAGAIARGKRALSEGAFMVGRSALATSTEAGVSLSDYAASVEEFLLALKGHSAQALRRMLNTPHKKHAPLKPKTKAKKKSKK